MKPCDLGTAAVSPHPGPLPVGEGAEPDMEGAASSAPTLGSSMCTCDRLDHMLALYQAGVPLEEALNQAGLSRKELGGLLESATEVMTRDKWGGEDGLADAITELVDLQMRVEHTLDLLDQIRDQQDRMFDKISLEIKRLTEGRLSKPRECGGRVVRIAGDADEA